MTSSAIIRPAQPSDVPAMFQFVVDLAEYERAPDKVVADASFLAESLFPTDGPAHLWGHVVSTAQEPDRLAGMAIWHLNYSTWEGRHGIYLEDLYVRPELRGQGLGRLLLATLAGVCVERGYPRLQWSVLDWNTPSIEFYRSLGAFPLDEWVGYRLEGAPLSALAGR